MVFIAQVFPFTGKTSAWGFSLARHMFLCQEQNKEKTSLVSFILRQNLEPAALTTSWLVLWYRPAPKTDTTNKLMMKDRNTAMLVSVK
jgi:hypothetical protein